MKVTSSSARLQVLCECYAPDMTPIPTNTRYGAKKIFDAKPEEVPWYGLEQVRQCVYGVCCASTEQVEGDKGHIPVFWF